MTRVIPCLLLRNKGLVKTIRFGKARYIGDPINAVRIFNEKEVDELIFLDIDASVNRLGPNYQMLRTITDECFMPLAYGGGVRTLEAISTLLSFGVEKVVLNSVAMENPTFVKEATHHFGSSTIVVCIDVKRTLLGDAAAYGYRGTKKTPFSPVEAAKRMEDLGAGELVVQSIDHDGTMAGYDLELIKSITSSVSIPVIALGGAGTYQDLQTAVDEGHASAAAAGSIFVYYGQKRGILINFPTRDELDTMFKRQEYATTSTG